jgi:hypothetical protein
MKEISLPAQRYLHAVLKDGQPIFAAGFIWTAKILTYPGTCGGSWRWYWQSQGDAALELLVIKLSVIPLDVGSDDRRGGLA